MMRYIALLLAVFGATWSGIYTTFGQGTITFANIGSGGLDAPVFMPDCVSSVAGSGFFAELYAGPAGSLEPQLGFVGGPSPFRPTETFPGYFYALYVVIPEVPYGEIATFQVRVYEAAAGSYETAVAGGWLHGKSLLFETTTGYSSGLNPPPPPFLYGLESFCLVPEPSTVALVFAGGLLLAGRRLRRPAGGRPR